MTNLTEAKPTLHYRPEIDGLRAIAVMSVIVYHFIPSFLPGGFLGVDVFFVISGYVITSSLLQDSSTPNLLHYLFAFYARRVRRLLPGLIFCVGITALIAWLLLPPGETSFDTAISAMFGVSNISMFNQKADYFTLSSSMNPFTQTWSLGVEEQFYFIFPTLLWALTSRDGKSDFGLILKVLIVSILSSVIAYILCVKFFSKSAAFYLMPFRFWELAAGSVLFLSINRTTYPKNKEFVLVMQLFACATLIALFFATGIDPEYLTIVCVLTTVLLIFSFKTPTKISSLISCKPMVYIGLLSYSLYLWHWSVLSLSNWTIGVSSSTIPFQILAVALAALISYYLIEKPLRFGVAKLWDSAVVGLGVVSICFAFFGLRQLHLLNEIWHLKADQFAENMIIPEAFLPLPGLGLPYNPTCVVDDIERKLLPNTVENCTFAPTGSATQTLWVMGDSHAGHLQAMLKAIHETTGIGIHLIETPGLPFPMLPDYKTKSRELIFEDLQKRIKPGDIVVISRLYFQRTDSKVPDLVVGLDAWYAELQKLATFLDKLNVSIVALSPPPIFRYTSTRTCFWKVYDFDPCEIGRDEQFSVAKKVRDSLESISFNGKKLMVFDPFPMVCPEFKKTCSPVIDGHLIFRDRDHLNSVGSKILSSPFLDFLSNNKLVRN